MEIPRRLREMPVANRLGHLGYAAATAVVVLIGVAWYEASLRTKAAARLIDRAFAIVEAVAQVSEYLGRSESANRGFHLYRRDGFLADRDAAIAQAEAAFGELASLTADRPAERVQVQGLRRLFDERVELMKTSDPTPRHAPEMTGRFYEIAGRIRAVELQTVAQKRADLQHQGERVERLLLGSVIVVLAVLLPGYLAFRREARERLRAQSQLFELTENLPGALFQFRRRRDGTMAYEFVTGAAERVRGIPRGRILADGREVFRTIHPEDLPGVEAAIDRSERELAALEVDYRVRMPDGGVRWIHTSAQPRRTSDGVLWSGHWGDVTERVELEKALRVAREDAEAATRAKSAFLATMSHEIRTPMNGILGMLELVLLGPLSQDQRTSLEVMSQSGRSLLRIIDDILDFSKMEAGKLELVPEPASVAAVLERVRDLFAGNASSKGLSLVSELDPELRPAHLFDPTRLQQVLGNLVSNAIKFSDGGRVLVSARLMSRDGNRDHIRFTVSDEGAGISADDQARLFQPFLQVGARPSGALGGTGLGLSICRRLVERMGGTIAMASAIGAGTTVTFDLPLEATDPAHVAKASGTKHDAPAAMVPVAPPKNAEARIAGSLVLIVDDHPINRMVLLRQANTLGYAAEVAADGAEALARWEEGGVGLVLTDCHMPTMDGYELAERIRKAEQAPGRARTPIVACTANALPGEAEKCFAAGMDDYLSKPIDLNALRQKLAAWLRAGPETGASQPPIDPGLLSEAAGGDPELEQELMRQFRKHNGLDVASARAAVETRDLAAVAQAFHRMAGSARMVGATALGDICRRIEVAALASDWPAAEAEMPKLARELERLEAHLEELSG